MQTYRWGDLYLGLSHEFEAVFTEQMARSFAEISGDVNPLHVDPEYAIRAGYAGPVLFGMLTSSLYSRLIGVYLPGRYALLQGIDLHFSAPCYAGDVLQVRGEVSFMSEAYRQLEVKSSIRGVGRKLISKALIRVGFHGE